MKFISFASSSKGNCSYISYKGTDILVDCGITRKKIIENLNKYDKTLNDIDYIFVTHEHSDHIGHIPDIIKDNKNIVIVSQKPTLIKIVELCKSKNITVDLSKFRIINPVNVCGEEPGIKIKDIKCYPIKGIHDVPILNYKFVLGDMIVAIMTDMGKYTDYILRSISDVNYLMLECNYDRQMLLNSARPVFLKERIMGVGGHLSNLECSEIIMKLAKGVLREVYLSHISGECNSEEYALKFVNDYIKNSCKEEINLPLIKVAKRTEETVILKEK